MADLRPRYQKTASILVLLLSLLESIIPSDLKNQEGLEDEVILIQAS